MTLLGKQRDKCRTQAQEDRNTRPVVWKHVLETQDAHIPCLRRFRRGTSQSDMIERPQDVVMPARREREPKKNRCDDFASPVGAKETVHQKKLTATALRGLHRLPASPTVRLI